MSVTSPLVAALAEPANFHPEKPLTDTVRAAVGHALTVTVLLTDWLTEEDGDGLTAATLALAKLAVAVLDSVALSLDDAETLDVADDDGASLSCADTLGVEDAAERVDVTDGDGGADDDTEALGVGDAAERVDVVEGDGGADGYDDALGEVDVSERVVVDDGVGGVVGESGYAEGESCGVFDA